MSPRGVAIAAALSVAVLAGAGAAAKSAVPAAAAALDPARPAESGARDSAATVGPFAIGAVVSDLDGVQVGHVARLTTDDQGSVVAHVRQGDDVYSIPIDDLFNVDGAAFTSLTREQLRHIRQASYQAH